MKLNLPTKYVEQIKETYGKKGEQWMKSLPDLLSQCTTKWNLEIGIMEPNLSYNYIAHVKFSSGDEAILKLLPHGEPFMEMEALELFDGNGTVKLLHSDHDLAAMIIEKISPGTSLRKIQSEDDEEATQIGAEMIKRAQGPVPKKHTLRTVSKEMEVIREVRGMDLDDQGTIDMLDKAIALLDELESTTAELKLIHGDLHHDNILFDKKKGWIAIDPKGRIGDPVYNAARFIQNMWDTKPTKDLIRRRVEILSDVLGYDEQRLIAWAFLDCVLSESWDLDEKGKRTGRLDAIIEVIDSLLQ